MEMENLLKVPTISTASKQDALTHIVLINRGVILPQVS